MVASNADFAVVFTVDDASFTCILDFLQFPITVLKLPIVLFTKRPVSPNSSLIFNSFILTVKSPDETLSKVFFMSVKMFTIDFTITKDTIIIKRIKIKDSTNNTTVVLLNIFENLAVFSFVAI